MSCKCMQLNTVLERNQEIDASELDGETVMMDMERGNYFMLNRVGSRVWELIEKPVSVEEIIHQLREEYEVSLEECHEAVKEFLHELHHANLLYLH